VIILTAFAERDLIQRALDAGAMTYLAKPFSTATLLPAIELAADRYADAATLHAEIAEATQRLQVSPIAVSGALWSNYLAWFDRII